MAFTLAMEEHSVGRNLGAHEKCGSHFHMAIKKENPEFMISPGFIDLPNADTLASTSNTHRRKLHRFQKNIIYM
jgi:hypothetical protein